MRLLAVAVCVCVAIMVRTATAQDEMVARLNTNGKRLNKLTARVVNLLDLIDTRIQTRRQAEVQSRNMNQRLDRIGGGMCKDTEFNCGNLKCIPRMLVCDYENDCGNNADEHESVCTAPALPGDTFTGLPVFDGCTSRQPKRAQIAILEAKRNPTYATLVDVKARLIMINDEETNEQSSLPLTGSYMYSDNKVTFAPPEEDRLGLRMQFSPGNNDVAVVTVVQELSGRVCAKFILRRDVVENKLFRYR